MHERTRFQSNNVVYRIPFLFGMSCQACLFLSRFSFHILLSRETPLFIELSEWFLFIDAKILLKFHYGTFRNLSIKIRFPSSLHFYSKSLRHSHAAPRQYVNDYYFSTESFDKAEFTYKVKKRLIDEYLANNDLLLQ